MPINEIIEIVILCELLIIGDFVCGMLGGFFRLVTGKLINLPIVGTVFKFFLLGPPHLAAITNPIAWAISSSGILLGLGIHQLIWGSPDDPLEFVAILVISVILLLGMAYKIITFDQRYAYLDTMFEGDAAWPLRLAREEAIRNYQRLDRHEIRSLAQMQFVDMTLPQLFRVFITIGVIYFCLGQLAILPHTGNVSPDLWESVKLSFSSIINIFSDTNETFQGPLWNLLRIITECLAFFWLVMFISLSTGPVEKGSEIVFEKYGKKN